MENRIDRLDQKFDALYGLLASIKDKTKDNARDLQGTQSKVISIASDLAELKLAIKEIQSDFIKFKEEISDKREIIYRAIIVKLSAIFLAIFSAILTYFRGELFPNN